MHHRALDPYNGISRVAFDRAVRNSDYDVANDGRGDDHDEGVAKASVCDNSQTSLRTCPAEEGYGRTNGTCRRSRVTRFETSLGVFQSRSAEALAVRCLGR